MEGCRPSFVEVVRLVEPNLAPIKMMVVRCPGPQVKDLSVVELLGSKFRLQGSRFNFFPISCFRG